MSYRIAVSRLLVLLGAVTAVFLLVLSDDVGADEPLPPPVEHVVEQGDTLWGLAAPLTDAGADVRVVVDQVLELNGLEQADLRPGQVILLPARG